MKFIDTFKKVQQQLTRPLSILLALSITAYPFIPWQPVKYIIIGVLGGVILKIIFEIESNIKAANNELNNNIKASNDEINNRLKSIQEIVNTPHPPNWKNFPEAQKAILLTIYDLLEQGENIQIEMIGVSARYSWRMVEDEMAPIIKKYETRSFTVDVIIVDEDLLKMWGLNSWAQDLNRTIKGIIEFQNQLKEDVLSSRLVINKYFYDSLPQWHGVLINKKVLFLGRTQWILNPDGSWVFKVGQCDYRRFEPTDKFGGSPRVRMFNNWVERLKSRNIELQNLKK